MMGVMRMRAALISTVLLIAVSSACASTQSGAGGLDPAINKTQAEQVLTRYLTVNAKAETAHDASLAVSVATGIAAEITRTSVAFGRFGTTPPASSVSRPVFVIPRFRGYPRWFAVFGVNGSQRMTSLVFEEARQGAPWLASAAATFLNPPAIPAMASDSSGYATAVGGTAPDQAAAAHVSCLNSVSRPGDCGVMAPGQWTTGIVARMRQTSTQAWRIGATWTMAPYPVFALRTADRGTFVWYSVTENGSAVNHGHGRAVPLTPSQTLLTGRKAVNDSFYFQSLYQFAAEIRPTGKISVVAENHQMIKAQGS
jgi:hypothetical protein